MLMVDLIGRALRSFKNLVVVATETAIRHSGFRINGWKKKLGKRWTRISNQCNATVNFRVRKMGWEAKKKRELKGEGKEIRVHSLPALCRVRF